MTEKIGGILTMQLLAEEQNFVPLREKHSSLRIERRSLRSILVKDRSHEGSYESKLLLLII